MSTLSLRLPNSIHRHAKRLAVEEGVSINQLISMAVAEKLSALDAERYLAERAVRGRVTKFRRILAKIPSASQMRAMSSTVREHQCDDAAVLRLNSREQK